MDEINLLGGSCCDKYTGDTFGKSPGLIFSYKECALEISIFGLVGNVLTELYRITRTVL